MWTLQLKHRNLSKMLHSSWTLQVHAGTSLLWSTGLGPDTWGYTQAKQRWSLCPQLTTHLKPRVTTYKVKLQSHDSKGSIFHSPPEWPSVALTCPWEHRAKLKSHFCQNGGVLLLLTASGPQLCAGPLYCANHRAGQKGGELWDPPILVKWTMILSQWSVKTHQQYWTDPAAE